MQNKNIHGIMSMLIALSIEAAVVSASARTVRVETTVNMENPDDTQVLQAAIDSGVDEVVVPNIGRPWVVRPLTGRSNLLLSFEKGAVVVAKKGEFKNRLDCLFRFDCCTNVVLRGYGATLRMHRLDYHSKPYKRSEWRHGLSFLSCSDVKIEGLSIVETGGDAIYLGVNVDKDPELTNFRVEIRDVKCLRNNRQGISVISAEDLLIVDCELSETYGTSPEAGIDFEPNRPDQRFVNCRVKNCRMRNNMGSGFELWCPRFDATTRPVSILVEDCETECNNEEIRFRDYSRKYGKPKTQPCGTLTFRNCRFRNMRNEYIYAAHETGRGIALKIENCTFEDDPYPDRLSVKKAVQILDDSPGKMKPVPAMTQTGWIGYAVCASGPRSVTLKAKIGKAAPLPARKGRPVKGLVIVNSLQVFDAEGKKVASLPLPPGDESVKDLEWRFDVPEEGVYTFGGYANRSVAVVASDVPIAVDATKCGHDFLRATGDLYVYVPAGTERVVITADGKSRQERVSVAIVDPSGRLRGKRTWVESCERYMFRDPEVGLWKIELREPFVGRFGAHGLDFIGGLGYLFLDKGRTWR